MARRKNKTINGSQQVDLSASPSETKETVAEKENLVDVGFDISTAIIGVCILDHKTGDLIMMNHIKFSPAKHKTLWQKADYAKAQIQALCANKGYTFCRIFVEENAKRFTPGFSSADTILTLAKFNGIISYLSRGILGTEPVDVNVTSARSKLGIKYDRNDKTKTTKEKVREQVKILWPDLPYKTHIAKTGKSKGQLVLDKAMEDEIDAFVIAKGGQAMHPAM
jgi:hypothetical protein